MSGSIGFNPAGGSPATINYSVPLPGQVTGRRIVRLDLGLVEDDYRESVRSAGTSFASQAGITRDTTGAVDIDRRRAENFLRTRMLRMGYDAQSVERALTVLPTLLSGRTDDGPVFRRRRPDRSPADELPDSVLDGVVVDPVLGDPLDLVKQFATKAVEGVVVVPGSTPGGSGTVEEVPPQEEPDPQLFLVETYAISSFLGDYGMGRTVRTFTLLPGESTTIRLKTWQSSSESIKKSSSIIDSHEQSAKERFASTVQDETTDKKTKEDTKKWSVEAEASGSWGFGSASAKASASGEYHSAREQFSKSVSESVAEHARDASSKRELSVSSSSEATVETGEESVVEREIDNVNMRRVLNFVFRELNQVYTTKTHLTDLQLAFTNGLSGTWRQVPLSGLRTLLLEVLEEAKVDEVARAVLKAAGTVFAADAVPVRTLQKVTYDAVTDTATVSDVVLDDQGLIAPPTESEYYRLRRGPLGQEGATNPVDGVLLSEQTVVMRTDSVIVEALLGEADALDSYAQEIQEAAARRDTLANAREELLQSTVAAIADPEARAEAAALLLVPAPRPTSEEADA